jgi:hypothetical protein
VQRAVVDPRPVPLSPPLELPAPVQRQPAIQRAETNENTSGESEKQEGPPNYERMAEAVWPHIRRKIRIERERERGLPS